MRSINAALTAAQKEASRSPHVTAVIKNQTHNVRRLDFTLINDTVNGAAKHDIACDSDGNVHRVRMQAGAVKYNRVVAANTGNDASYDSFVDLATSRGTAVAVSARGLRVIVVYTDAVGLANVFYRESTDGGATFGAEASATAAPGGVVFDLAVAYKNSTGDLLIAWTLAASMRAIKRTAGAFGSVLNPGDSFASLTGIAATYAFDYELIITGQEVTTNKPTVWTRVFGDGSAQTLDTWSSLQRMVQMSDNLGSFESPFLDYLDTWRASFAELPSWAGGTTRHYRTSLHQQLLFTAGPFSWHTPLPSDDTFTQSLAIAHTPTHFYESGPHLVRRAPTALVSRDVSADLLALEIHEDPLDAHGWIEIRNADKQYAGPPDPVKVGNLVELAFGYQTQQVAGPPLQLVALTTSASPRTSTRLTAGAWGALKTVAGVTDNNPRPTNLGGGVLMATNGTGTPARSTDNGETWSAMSAALAGAIAFARDGNGTRIWCVVDDPSGGGAGVQTHIHYSDNSGASWTLAHSTGSNTREPIAFACHPTESGRFAVIGQSNTGAGWCLFHSGSNPATGYVDHTAGSRPDIGQSGVPHLYGMIMLSSGRLVASGPLVSGAPISWRIHTCDDDGATWDARFIEVNNNIDLYPVRGTVDRIVAVRFDHSVSPRVTQLLVSDDGGTTFDTLTPAQTLATFVGNNNHGFTDADYDPSTDSLFVATGMSTFAVVQFTPCDYTGDWYDLHDAIPSNSFGSGNLAVIASELAQAGGPFSSQIQDLWITAIEQRRDSGAQRRGRHQGDAITRLYVEGGLRRLRRSFQRYHVSHPATDDMRTIIAAILLRSGMALSVTSSSTRSDTFAPNFHIAPDHSGAVALRAALNFLADRLRVRAAGVVHMDEPLVSDTTDYSVLFHDQPGEVAPSFPAGTADGSHRAYAQLLRDEPPPIGEAMMLGLTSGAYLQGQAFHHAHNEHGLAPLGRIRDLTTTIASEAKNTAEAYLRQRTLDQDLGRVTAPPVCGLELLDVLTVSDVYSASSALLRRVRGITWRYDKAASRYEQDIALGPV